MAKKGNAVQLSPEEFARIQAKEMLELELKKNELEKRIEALKSELKDFVSETGITDLGSYVVSKSEAKPKLNFGELTPNAQKRVVEVLMKELPDFIRSKNELDIERMYYAQSSTPAVSNALKVHGLNFELVSSLVFRKAASAN